MNDTAYSVLLKENAKLREQLAAAEATATKWARAEGAQVEASIRIQAEMLSEIQSRDLKLQETERERDESREALAKKQEVSGTWKMAFSETSLKLNVSQESLGVVERKLDDALKREAALRSVLVEIKQVGFECSKYAVTEQQLDEALSANPAPDASGYQGTDARDDTPKPELPVIEEWHRIAAHLASFAQDTEEAAGYIASGYASKRARLRRELLALAKKWVTSAGNDFYPTDTCASDIRAFIDRELPEQGETKQ